MPAVDDEGDDRADILLVGTVPADLQALENILADLGQNLVRAASGNEALRLLAEGDFAVVLLDLQIPGLDGLATAQQIRSRERSRSTPIIFLTTPDPPDFPMDQAYELGAVDYLVKPLVPVILRAKVRGFVELSLQTRQLERRRAEDAFLEEGRIAETLYRITKLLAAERDLHRLVQIVTDEARALTEAQFGAFFYNRHNERGESYMLYTLSGVPPEAFARFPMPRNTAIFEPTFRGQGVVRLGDVTRDPRYGRSTPHHGMPPGHLPVRSYLAVPVVARSGTVLGGLFFGHSDPGVFSERHERLIVGVAAAAAVAIDNAHLYEQLQRRAEELVEEGKRKDHFLATLGHELRNPLAPLHNCIAILSLTGGPASPETLAMIERQIRTLTRLVDDLLVLSRISRGLIELKKERIELGAAVLRATEAVRPLIHQCRHRLEIQSSATPVWLLADPVRLEQILTNLLSNAAKYTEPGGHILVSSGREAGRAVVRVRDTGIGIRPEDLRRIFEDFTHAGRVEGRVQEGLGIGLSLVKGLVDLHEGSVDVFSEGPGQGSEFVVRLPALLEEPLTGRDRASDPGGTTGRGLRILVVDDNTDAADSCADLLRAFGHEPRVAYDGLAP